MHINDTSKLQLAQSLTELAIQNNLIDRAVNAAETAKEVSTFFNTIIKTIDNPSHE